MTVKAQLSALNGSQEPETTSPLHSLSKQAAPQLAQHCIFSWHCLTVSVALPQAKPCRTCSGEESDAQVSPAQSNSDFSHPVYKEIALANGHINRMSKQELRNKLAELQLDTR